MNLFPKSEWKVVRDQWRLDCSRKHARKKRNKAVSRTATQLLEKVMRDKHWGGGGINGEVHEAKAAKNAKQPGRMQQ